jgi:hypothetical protein
MEDDRMTPEEREAFGRLPRERMPNSSVEERTVARLRRTGFLEPRPRPGWALSPAWGVAAAAAVVAIAVACFALGQWTGSRQTAEAMLALRGQDALTLAAEVQRTGTAYVRALTALAGTGAANPAARAQGREAAVAALHAAAETLLTLDPKDPVAARILMGLAGFDRTAGGEGRIEQGVAWF